MNGGLTGEALETLTGGVTSSQRLESVDREDALWEELKQCGQGRPLFNLATWDDSDTNGLVSPHAYTILGTAKIRNADGSVARLVRIL